MRPSRPLRLSALALLLAVDLVMGAGCGESGPPTGTAASPVDPAEAAKQREATEAAYKNMGKNMAKKSGPRK